MRGSSSTGFPEFLGKSIVLLPGVAVPALSTALALPVLTRVLPGPEFGLFSLLTSLVLLSQSLTSGWLTTAIIRYRPAISEDLQKRRFELTVYKQVASWSAIMAGLYMSGLGLITFLGSPPHAYWLLPLQVLALNAIAVVAQIDRGDGNAALFNLLNVSRAVASVALGLVAVEVLGPSALSYMCGATVAWVAIALLPLFRFVRLSRRRVGHDTEMRRKLLTFGLPLIPTFVFVQVLDVSDRFVIGIFLGHEAVGAYAAGYMLASFPFQMLILVLGAAAAPHLVRLWVSKSSRVAEDFCQMLCRVLLILGVPLIVSSVTNEQDYRAIIGPGSLAAGTNIMPIVSTAGLVLALQWVAQRGLLLQERTKAVLVAYCLAGTVNVLANVALVPAFGIAGAAWNTLACNLLVLILIARAATPFRWWPAGATVVLICFAATAGTVLASSIAARATGDLSVLGSAARLGVIGISGVTIALLVVALSDRLAGISRGSRQTKI